MEMMEARAARTRRNSPLKGVLGEVLGVHLRRVDSCLASAAEHSRERDRDSRH